MIQSSGLPVNENMPDLADLVSSPDGITGFGRAVRGRRKALGLTQKDLAELAGVSIRFVHDIERGKPSIRLQQLLQVISALGLTLTLRRRLPELYE